jgi:hypothetical protein
MPNFTEINERGAAIYTGEIWVIPGRAPMRKSKTLILDEGTSNLSNSINTLNAQSLRLIYGRDLMSTENFRPQTAYKIYQH